MTRRDIGTDDSRVKVRPGRGSRPRTKIRPDYSKLPRGRVFRIDRGRYGVRISQSAAQVTAVKARELRHGSVAIGDICALNGDLSGRKDTLARIVSVDPRKTVLRRTAEEGESAGSERVIVANADLLAIVSAAARPTPRYGMIDRCLVAAYDAGMTPVLILTKTDLADPQPVLDRYRDLGLRIVCSATEREEAENANKTECGGTAESVPVSAGSLREIKALLRGHISVLVGHSGVGKSTLINALVPGAARATSAVNSVTGRGRHTSTSAVAFELPGGGTVIDTPGVRTFGLAHVDAAGLLRGFPDLAELAASCPRGCGHRPEDPGCAFDTVSEPAALGRIRSFRRLLCAAVRTQWG